MPRAVRYHRRRRRSRYVTGVRPFLPSDLSGFVLDGWPDFGQFQDAARTTPASADGDPVGGVEEQSGAGNHLSQATAGNRPLIDIPSLNGRNAWLFDGSSDRLAVPSLASAAQTLFIVCQLTNNLASGGTFKCPVSLAGLEILIFNGGGYKDVSFIYGGTGTSSGFDASGAKTNTAPHVIGVGYGGGGVSAPANYRASFDGAIQTVVASGAFGGGSGSTIGSRGAGAFWEGKVARVLVYDSLLSESDFLRVDAYLRSYYGL